MRNFKMCIHQTTFVSSNQGNEMGGAYGRWGGKKRNSYRGLVGKSEGQRPLIRPNCRGDDNIKKYL